MQTFGSYRKDWPEVINIIVDLGGDSYDISNLIIGFLPRENGKIPRSGMRITSEDLKIGYDWAISECLAISKQDLYDGAKHLCVSVSSYISHNDIEYDKFCKCVPETEDVVADSAKILMYFVDMHTYCRMNINEY